LKLEVFGSIDRSLLLPSAHSTRENPAPSLCKQIYDGKRIIDKYKLPGRGEEQEETFIPVATAEIQFKKQMLEEWRAMNKAHIPIITAEIYGHYTQRNPQRVVSMTYETIPADGTKRMAGVVQMEDFHRRGNGSMSNYIKDYAEIFDNQPEDLRENEMMDWDMMKRL